MRATAEPRAGLSRGAVAAVVVSTVAAALVRLPNLRALPIFGDEAIILRIARIVRADPLERLWAPLLIPYAPLHDWLLALALPLSADPVVAGRLLSVFFGVLLVPALAIAVDWIGRAFSPDQSANAWAAVIALLSPFLVFSGRIARPDSLFALETVLVAGLSVVLAVSARPLFPAIGLGVLMGLTMLTRQGVSYPLWVLPIGAFASLRRRDWGTLVLPLLVAAVVAVVLWVPMLLAPGWPPLADRIFQLVAIRPPLSLPDRGRLFAHNLGIAVAAFWTYLTPPVFVAGLAGFGVLASTRRTVFAFFLTWELLLLLPPVLFAGDYFPRYAVPAAPPFLAAAAFALAWAWRRSRRWARLALLVAVFAWPAGDILRSVASWRSWPLLPIDRRQFVSGWSAGAASEEAAALLKTRAGEGPIAVVVPHVSGNPSDAVWFLLEGVPNVRLFYSVDFLRRPALAVRGDVWLDAKETEIDLRQPVFFVSPDPVFLGRAGWAPAADVVRPLNPGAHLVARFENPPNERGRVESAVVIYRLR